MIALKTIDIRNDFKRVSALIGAGEKVLIARPHNDNLVLLSEKEYNELEKAKRNAEYLAMLDESMYQYTEGKVVIKTLEDIEAME
jgi:antitoxin YefM